MTDLYWYMFIQGLVGLAIGFWLGRNSEASRWEANADRIQRIESGGKLYKVHHD